MKNLQISISKANHTESAIRIFLDEASSYNAMTLGAGSYCVNATFEFGNGRMNHVLVGRYTSIGHNVIFLSGYNHDYKRVSTYPFEDIMNGGSTNGYTDVNHYQIIIGNDVWIGRGVTILGGVRIGNGAVIGANSVVAKNVPPYAIVVGNPAKVIKYRFEEDIISKLQKIKWWYWDRKLIEKRLTLMKEPELFIKHFYQEDSNFSIKKLVEIKEQGIKIFFNIVDFEVSMPVWEYLVNQYLKTYIENDKIQLILGTSSDEKILTVSNLINNMNLKIGSSAPAIILININNINIKNILFYTDVFISNREEISSICIDYSYDYGVDVISGLNKNIFPKNL